METATQAPVSGRPADKVLQALATLAALIDATIREVKSLDGEFQTRLLQAVHETEASLQAQTAEHVGRARQEVQLELDSKFQNDLQAALNSIKSEFESERERFSKDLLKASETASRLEAERSTWVEQVERVKADSAAELAKAQEDLNGKFQNELQSTIEGLKVEFEAERQKARENAMKAVQDAEGQLKAQAAEQVEHARVEVEERLHTKHKTDLQCALDALKGEFEVERGRLNEVASKLELQLAGLLTEVQQVKADSATEIENARAEAKAAAATKQAAPAEPAAPPAALQEEIQRSETKLQEILKLIDNPATELSTVIRKNVERSELEAYLKGIRLVLGATS